MLEKDKSQYSLLLLTTNKGSQSRRDVGLALDEVARRRLRHASNVFHGAGPLRISSPKVSSGKIK